MSESGSQEGTLWKWTNYFTGWQPRWFVLEQGILSYYRSQDDVNNGCKGSIKMSVCDVNVHPTDSLRLDLIIPGEAHFYVRAATTKERQQWLVVLGSCKACLNNGTATTDQVQQDGISVEELRSKKSELRLYCDLLMQQVQTVKSAVNQPNTPDVMKLDEATSLLSATCDTFLVTLDECLQLTQASSICGSNPSSPLPNVVLSKPLSPSGRHKNGRAESMDGAVVPPIRHPRPHRTSRGNSRSRTASESSEVSVIDGTTPNAVRSNSVPMTTGSTHIPEDDEASRCPTFFTELNTSFMDLRLAEDAGIPVLPFLEACRPVLQLFDKLNSTAFAPVKLDIAGNIRKIQQKHSTNTEKFECLQHIVLFEIAHRQNHLTQSATVALLWLKRSLEFIREFLHEIMTSQEDLQVTANTAYSRTLRRYHSLVVRGVFALAVKAVPPRQDFLSHFATSPEHLELPGFERSLLQDMEDYITALDVVLRILNDFYTAHNIDSDELV